MSRPNLLILHTDQQRFDTIAGLGHAHVHTPNIDRLVKRGTSFTSAYSSNPICMPARHDLLTGVSARHHGYWGNSNEYIKNSNLDTIPRLLSREGYQTYAVGKMHFKPHREHFGYGHMRLMEEIPPTWEDDDYIQYLQANNLTAYPCQHGVRPIFYHSPQPALIPEKHHGSAWVADQTIKIIQADRVNPFYIMTSWVGPHPPYYVPQKYLDQYKDANLPPCCPSQPEDALHTPPCPDGQNPQSMAAMRESYFAAITLIDTHLGRILDCLEQTGQIDNTLIVFMADHGEMLGDRGMYQKHVPWEGSAHIPMIACGPDIPVNHISTTPVNTWDVSATLLEVAGIQPPSHHPMVGTSLREQTQSQPQRIVVSQHGQNNSRYVTTIGYHYKYTRWAGGGHEKLFDLNQDPTEQHDLLLDPDALTDHQKKINSELRQAALDWEIKHGPENQTQDGQWAQLEYHSFSPQNGSLPRSSSLYPYWASKQFPKWTNGYRNEDYMAIINQMQECIKANPDMRIPKEIAWHEEAIKQWKNIGGPATAYENILKAIE